MDRRRRLYYCFLHTQPVTLSFPAFAFSCNSSIFYSVTFCARKPSTKRRITLKPLRSEPPQEKTLLGLPTAPGVAIGEVYLYRHDLPQFREVSILPELRRREVDRFRLALGETRNQLTDLRDRLATQAGETAARIFDAQLLILEDVEFLGKVEAGVTERGVNAEPIVAEVAEGFRSRLAALEGTVFHQRAQDVADIGQRIIRNLLGHEGAPSAPLDRPCILVADDLLPSDVVHLLRENVLAVATDLGGAASHTAILTKSLEVPAVVGLKEVTRLVQSGDRIIVNGNSGKVIVHPEPETLVEYEAKRQHYVDYIASLEDIELLPAETLDGRRVTLNANIELPHEVKSAFSRGGDGIGLFRSEYLLLTRRRLPTEDEQYEDYRRVIETAAPRQVTIRTYDIGGDKVFPDMPRPVEANPFMGWRAIRVCLDHPKLLRDQLKAILRAAVYGSARIMFPLVIGLDDLLRAKQELAVAIEELNEAGVEYCRDVPIGIMVELPSTVIMSERLAREVDFFSIGTNDLTQFTLAVDRGNEKVQKLYQPIHPAVIRLIALTVKAAKAAGIEVAMCGEMAAAPLATMVLVGLGLDELSVSPVALPEIKKLIRSMTYADARAVAQHALSIESESELLHYCSEEVKERFADLPIWFNNG